MIRGRYIGNWVVGVGALLAAGCSDREPPPPHFTDLGTADRPLLPTSSAWHDPNVVKGASEWRPFQPVKSEPVADEKAAEAGKPGDAPAGDTPAGKVDAEKVEAEVRSLIADFNEKVAAGAPQAERLEFFVKGQHPTLKEIATAVDAFRGKLTELRDAVKEKAPEGAALLDRVIVEVRSPDNEAMQIENFAVEGAEAARARIVEKVPGSSPDALREIRFKVEDEYWCIEFAAIDQLAASVQMLRLATQQFDTLVQGVRSGQVPAEALLAQLKPLEAMLPGAKGPDAASPPSAVGKPEGEPPGGG